MGALETEIWLLGLKDVQRNEDMDYTIVMEKSDWLILDMGPLTFKTSLDAKPFILK